CRPPPLHGHRMADCITMVEEVGAATQMRRDRTEVVLVLEYFGNMNRAALFKSSECLVRKGVRWVRLELLLMLVEEQVRGHHYERRAKGVRHVVADEKIDVLQASEFTRFVIVSFRSAAGRLAHKS